MTDPLDPYTWTDDQHLIWNYLSRNDVFPQVQQWPAWAQIQAINMHKSDNEVFNFMYFLIANGLPADDARTWALAKTVKEGRIQWDDTHVRYTKKETGDASRIMYKAIEGRLLTGKKRVYDLTAGRPLMW